MFSISKIKLESVYLFFFETFVCFLPIRSAMKATKSFLTILLVKADEPVSVIHSEPCFTSSQDSLLCTDLF